MDPMMLQAIMGKAESTKQGIGGLIQAGIGLFGGRKARKALENLQTPVYTPAKSISDYYAEAKNRYGISPYASTLYKATQQGIGRNINQGISALQDRRLGIGGISSLMQAGNDATLKAGIAAEQEQNQRFGQLGAASQAMAGEERQAFNINKIMPYEKRYNMLAMKAQGYNELLNSGLKNIFGGSQAGAAYGSALGGMSGMQGQSNPSYGYGADSNLPASTYRVPLAKY
jgi:hypothetical protein